VIYSIGGIGGAFAKTVAQLLTIRAIFGIGVGLIIPLSTSLIADFFEGTQRTRMMGLSGSVSHFGGVVFLLLSGWLAGFGWQNAFFVYGLSIVILGMVALWVPEPQVKRPAAGAKAKLPLGVYLCALWGALIMIAFYAAPTNLAMFIESEQIGKAQAAGFFLSAMTMTGVVIGVILATLMKWFGRYFPAIGVGVMAVGYALLGIAHTKILVVAAMLCIGFSSGVLMPLLLLEVARLSPEVSRAFGMAVVSVGVYLGQFLSPVVLKFVSLILGKDAFGPQFNFLAISLAIAAAATMALAFKNRKQAFPAMAQANLHH
jgi:MFS family permease